MSVKTDTENKKGMLVLGQLPQTSAMEAAELEASCLKEAWSKKAWEDALEDKNAWYAGAWLDGRLVGCCGLRTSATLRWIRPSDGRESVNSCFFF